MIYPGANSLGPFSLTTVSQQEERPIRQILYLGNLLETCHFQSFWVWHTNTQAQTRTRVCCRAPFSPGQTTAVIPPDLYPFSNLAKVFTCHHFLLTDKPGGEPRAHWWHHWLRGLRSQVWVSCCESVQRTWCPHCKTSMSSLAELGSSQEAHTPMSGCWVKEMEIRLNTG